MLTKSKLTLATALILATASAALAENNAVPGERDPNPVARKGLLENRSVYDARMQAGRSAPTIYIEKSDGYFDRASQTFDGAGM